MSLLRRIGGGCPFHFRLICPAVFILLGTGLLFSLEAQTPPYKIEIRVTDEPVLQLLDNEGKLYQTLPLGTVRKRVSVQDTLLLVSFGEDSQHHSIVMLGLNANTGRPTPFLFGRNVIIASPEAILTFQLTADHSTAQISPSLTGQIWINGDLLSRGETKKLQLRAAKSPGPGDGIVPTPDQPKPTTRDFQSIAVPSI